MLFGLTIAVLLRSEPTPHLEGVAEPAVKLVRELVRQGAKDLAVDAKLGQEVVFIRSIDQPLSVVKEKLATALDATWVKNPSGEVLTRLPAQEKLLLQQHRERRIKEVNSAFQALRDSLSTPFDARALALGLSELKSADPNDRQGQIRVAQLEKKYYGQGAVARLLKNLILACRPEDLAAIGPYERGVFTIHPTKKQHGFDTKRFQAAASQFAKEQRDWVDAAATVTFPKDPNGSMVTDPRTQTGLSPDMAQNVHLNVIRGDMTGLFMVNLVADEGLNVMGQENVADSARVFLDGQMNPGPIDPKDPLVTYSRKATEDLIKHAMAMFGAGGDDVMSPELRQVLFHPDEIDPQDLVVKDAFDAYAQKLNKNVVALLSDDAFNWITFMAVQRPIHAEQAINGLVQAGTLTREEVGDWLVFKPLDSVNAKAGFTPRAAMANLLKSIDDKGALLLTDYADYAFATHRINRTGLGEVWMMLLDRSYGSLLDHVDWNGLKLYGSLSKEQQRQLEGGSEFRLMTLNPEQKSIVDRIVYGKEIRSESWRDNNSSFTSNQPIEPTEMFANGLPDDGTLSAKVKTVPIIYAYGKTADGKIRPLRQVNEPTIAAIETNIVGNAEKMAQYSVKGLVGYAMGCQKTILLRVNVAKGIWREFAIMEPIYDPNAKPGKWTDLPTANADLVRSSLKQQGTQGNGGTISPLR